MMRVRRSPVHQIAIVVALTSLALLASFLLRPVNPDSFTLFLASVAVSAWFYGLRAGLLATAISAMAVLFFFPPPPLQPWTVQSSSLLIRFAAFVLVSVLISVLTAGLLNSRGLLAATLSSIGEAVVVTDRDGRITFLNPAAEGLTGWKQTEAKGKPAQSVLRLLNEKTGEPIEHPTGKVIREGRTVGLVDPTVLVSKDGAQVPIESSAAPIRDETGDRRGVILVFRDITGRRHLQDQLSHAQKMEAVSRVVEGVAGELNNVLTVITGYSDLLSSELSLSNPLRRFVNEILVAAERSAGLTRHLMAFGSSPTVQPKPLDLNFILSTMENGLRRDLGPKIELILLSGPNLGKIRADPGQIEQVILNLANNARDAMPDGGKLVMETANVELEDARSSSRLGMPPGSYVMVAVSDNGIGMDRETRSRLFEPFFTTKEPGKAAGLGLSTVYGIVSQCQGHISVYSQLGCGTIFELYFPRDRFQAPPAPDKGSETILLVDDEDGVRKVVSTILQNRGYKVIEARDGVEAIAAYETNRDRINLVVTDLVMPQMDGFELGEQLASRNASLKILYMSGFRDTAGTARNGEPDRAFLNKPFTPDALVRKVRECLDQDFGTAQG